jgi:hypothetical protein
VRRSAIKSRLHARSGGVRGGHDGELQGLHSGELLADEFIAGVHTMPSREILEHRGREQLREMPSRPR